MVLQQSHDSFSIVSASAVQGVAMLEPSAARSSRQAKLRLRMSVRIGIAIFTSQRPIGLKAQRKNVAPEVVIEGELDGWRSALKPCLARCDVAERSGLRAVRRIAGEDRDNGLGCARKPGNAHWRNGGGAGIRGAPVRLNCRT